MKGFGGRRTTFGGEEATMSGSLLLWYLGPWATSGRSNPRSGQKPSVAADPAVAQCHFSPEALRRRGAGIAVDTRQTFGLSG